VGLGKLQLKLTPEDKTIVSKLMNVDFTPADVE